MNSHRQATILDDKLDCYGLTWLASLSFPIHLPYNPTQPPTPNPHPPLKVQSIINPRDYFAGTHFGCACTDVSKYSSITCPSRRNCPSCAYMSIVFPPGLNIYPIQTAEPFAHQGLTIHPIPTGPVFAFPTLSTINVMWSSPFSSVSGLTHSSVVALVPVALTYCA